MPVGPSSTGSAPTYFPAVEGRYVDGGVGSYINPCYLAAYEARFCLGTGRDPHTLQPGDADRFWAWDWIGGGGDELGRKILADETDRALEIRPACACAPS